MADIGCSNLTAQRASCGQTCSAHGVSSTDSSKGFLTVPTSRCMVGKRRSRRSSSTIRRASCKEKNEGKNNGNGVGNCKAVCRDSTSWKTERQSANDKLAVYLPVGVKVDHARNVMTQPLKTRA